MSCAWAEWSTNSKINDPMKQNFRLALRILSQLSGGEAEHNPVAQAIVSVSAGGLTERLMSDPSAAGQGICCGRETNCAIIPKARNRSPRALRTD